MGTSPKTNATASRETANCLRYVFICCSFLFAAPTESWETFLPRALFFISLRRCATAPFIPLPGTPHFLEYQYRSRLDAMLRRMRFGQRTVEPASNCFRSVRMAVHVNSAIAAIFVLQSLGFLQDARKCFRDALPILSVRLALGHLAPRVRNIIINSVRNLFS